MQNEDPEIDAKEASQIARAMRAVAAADGEVHLREMQIIEAFERDLPIGTSTVDSTLRPALHSVYLRSLAMVALADGRITAEEQAQIEALADAAGIPSDLVGPEILEAKKYFLSVFRGARVFRDSVVAIAKDLGLAEDEIHSLLE